MTKPTETRLAEVYARIAANAAASGRTWFNQMAYELAPQDHDAICAYADRVHKTEKV